MTKFSTRALIFIFIASFGIIVIFELQNEAQNFAVRSLSESAPVVAQNGVLAASYDANKWNLISSNKISEGGAQSKILLLKSKNATGESGTGDSLYDVDLVVTKDNKVAYDYVTQGVKPSESSTPNATKF